MPAIDHPSRTLRPSYHMVGFLIVCCACWLCTQVPQFQLPPQPWQVGWKLQDGMRINKDLHQLLTNMLMQMNKASATLPTLQSVTQ